MEKLPKTLGENGQYRFPTPVGIVQVEFVFNYQYTVCILVNEQEYPVGCKAFTERELQQGQISDLQMARETLSHVFSKGRKPQFRHDKLKTNIYGRPCMIKAHDGSGKYTRRNSRRR